MTWSPATVEMKMQVLTERIEGLVDDLEHQTRRASDARTNYDVEFAKAMLAAQSDDTLKTEGARKSHCLVQCADLLRERRTSEAIVEATKGALAASKEEAGLLRTMLVQAREVQDRR